MKKYIILFALAIGTIKALLTLLSGQPVEEAFSNFAIFTFIGAVLAIPLWFFKQEKNKNPDDKTMENIMGLTVLVAVGFGIVHDQILVRSSLTYFTVGHNPLPGITNLTLLGIAWGILGTWWAGLIGGMIFALVARSGSRPKLSAREIIFPVVIFMSAVEALSWGIHWLVRQLYQQGVLFLPEPYASLIPESEYAGFLANWYVNAVSYGLAALGLIGIGFYLHCKRKKLPT